MTLHVRFIDRGYEPQCPPNPAYPNGMDVNLAGDRPNCMVALGELYPAPRCGYYLVHCDSCGSNALLTCAGRVDDVRSVKLPCKKGKLS